MHLYLLSELANLEKLEERLLLVLQTLNVSF